MINSFLAIFPMFDNLKCNLIMFATVFLSVLSMIYALRLLLFSKKGGEVEEESLSEKLSAILLSIVFAVFVEALILNFFMPCSCWKHMLHLRYFNFYTL
jgi:hypothetical protein